MTLTCALLLVASAGCRKQGVDEKTAVAEDEETVLLAVAGDYAPSLAASGRVCFVRIQRATGSGADLQPAVAARLRQLGVQVGAPSEAAQRRGDNGMETIHAPTGSPATEVTFGPIRGAAPEVDVPVSWYRHGLAAGSMTYHLVLGAEGWRITGKSSGPVAMRGRRGESPTSYRSAARA